MADEPIYDDQNQGDDFDPSKLRSPEEDQAAEQGGSDDAGDGGGNGGSTNGAPTGKDSKAKKDKRSEDEKLNDQLSGAYGKAQEKDRAEAEAGKGVGEGKGGLYKGDPGTEGAHKKTKKLLKNKKFIVGAGGGVIGIVLVITSLFSFLNIFKLDFLLQNIDAETFSRFNASFSGRSDKYLKAYIKMRLGEVDNKNGGNNVFFKAGKVDTNKPVHDWYRTLRSNNFEEKVFNKNGYTFASLASTAADGTVTLHPAKITFKNIDSVDFPTNSLSPEVLAGIKAGDVGSLAALGKDIDKFVDSEVFNSDKEARRAIKIDVNKETRSFQVLKRYHLRKDIQNKTGILSWRFFETTRNKITASKVAIQQKILKKVLPSNNTGKFLQCLFAQTCPVNADPQAPDNKLGGTFTGDAVNTDNTPDEQVAADGQSFDAAVDANNNPIKDAAGNPVAATTTEFGNKEISGDIGNAATNAVDGTIAEEAGKITLSPVQVFLKDTINKLIGNPYTKIWSWMKKFAAIEILITHGVLSKMVRDARSVQLTGVYSTYAIARDQIKTGQVTGEEVGNLMQTLDGVEHSEGWQVRNKNAAGNASAAPLTHVPKQEYCKLSDELKKQNDIQYFCERPSDANTPDAMNAAYKASPAYQLTHPMAVAVKTINESPLGFIFNSVSSLADKVLGTVLDPVISATLSATGAKDKLGTLVATGMGKTMQFLGAGPIFDGSQAGVGNFLIGGSAGMAETTTRGSGGVASTPTTLSYSTKLASDYQKGQTNNQSLFSRYASLSNRRSLLSGALFSVMNTNIGSGFASVVNSFSSLPKMFAGVFSGRVLAAQPATGAALAQWAGVDTYDLPQQCQDLDPLDDNYLADAVGVVPDAPYAAEAQGVLDSIRPLNIDVIRDGDQFWKKVYGEIGKNENSEQIATAIYDCAIMDARVEGSLGRLQGGYTNDGGLSGGL